MDIIEHLKSARSLSHAYLVYGGEDTLRAVQSFAKERSGGQGSPDALCFTYGTLGVDEARALSCFASLKPLGDRKYLVISFGASTVEAQNALLKIVEEGAGHSTFFFVVGTGTALLPTLLSRCVVLRSMTMTHGGERKGEEFLHMTYAERLSAVEKLGKDGDREEARALVESLLARISRLPKDPKALRDLLMADQYLKGSSASIKSILGHLALTL